jgi:hypothetical protein
VVVRLPLVAGGLAIYVALRFLAVRRKRQFVRLADGRRVRLLSAVALLNGSDHDLLALEYVPGVRSADPEALRLEAHRVLEAVAQRAEYAGCNTAVVTARGRVLTFRRGDGGRAWYPSGDSSSPPAHALPENYDARA